MLHTYHDGKVYRTSPSKELETPVVEEFVRHIGEERFYLFYVFGIDAYSPLVINNTLSYSGIYGVNQTVSICLSITVSRGGVESLSTPVPHGYARNHIIEATFGSPKTTLYPRYLIMPDGIEDCAVDAAEKIIAQVTKAEALREAETMRAVRTLEIEREFEASMRRMAMESRKKSKKEKESDPIWTHGPNPEEMRELWRLAEKRFL